MSAEAWLGQESAFGRVLFHENGIFMPHFLKTILEPLVLQLVLLMPRVVCYLRKENKSSFFLFVNCFLFVVFYVSIYLKVFTISFKFTKSAFQIKTFSNFCFIFSNLVFHSLLVDFTRNYLILAKISHLVFRHFTIF